MIFLFRVLSYAPLSWLHALGAGLGGLIWALSPTYRRHLDENLTLALGETAARKIRSSAIAHAGRQAMELPKIWLRPQDEVIQRVVKITGWELAEQAMREGKGILYLTPHLGCYEIISHYLSRYAPITVMYRPPKRRWMQMLIETGRKRDGLQIATADLSGVRTLLKALKRGEAVGMLPDQAPKVGEGLWVDFFGKPAYTMTLAARLSESGAAVIMLWVERLPAGAGFHFHLQAPRQALAGSTENRAQQISHEIEALIRQCPAQYLWGYNRYKRPAGAEPPPGAGEKTA
ncbi:lysophospholipid acyltransferase family protein [Propionivibrio dicarboxylicus]|uniref:KDO2-lipid IV(A) lauroyltransferase n=1 Tax=Propionivibrio dicarboxylicus TaxID=83767 RepID=A0A1G8L2Z8_9RHOO|nr:lysophospholipid acyltransferase family protein [Propionivibrio dicarboxylicus]SDI49520.1 KDO2-lipid IV(A) lauroyltransferase [Propionivibrio dicarboxylicus]